MFPQNSLLSHSFFLRQTKWMLSLWILSSVLFFQCETAKENAEGKKLRIVATTGMIGDGLVHLFEKEAEVTVLMGPGVDPHLYKASQRDLKILQEADLIVYNGLHLEGKMAEVLSKLSHRKKVIALGDCIKDRAQLLQPAEGIYDPHIWFDARLWRSAWVGFADTIAQLYPERMDSIRPRLNMYTDSLQLLDYETTAKLGQLPEAKRLLVTSHDAFSYFGRRYQMQVMALQGISTVSEFGLNDVKRLSDTLTKRRLPALFVESSVSARSIQALQEACNQKGHSIKIGGSLFSDALGPKNEPTGTYIGMFRHNVNTIFNALQNE
jgi:manganese/zinc/iron transport system substrate-binding protein